MAKTQDRKEFRGMGERCTVARAFGGVVEFDDGSVLIMLTVAGHKGQKLVYPLTQGKGLKAVDFMKRFAEEAAHEEGGEGLTDFERKVVRAACDFSMTDGEKAEYINPDNAGGLYEELFGDWKGDQEE